MSVMIEPIKPHIGGIVHLGKAHLCDDETSGRTMHRTTIMGSERLGHPWTEPQERVQNA